MKKILNLDNFILEYIRLKIKNKILDKIMQVITHLGDAGVLWIVISLVFLLTKSHVKYGILIVISLLFCMLIGNIILKPLIARVRPCDANYIKDLLIKRPRDLSFPSGHTMCSFASVTVIFGSNKKLGLIFFIIASLIAFSRLYLYVHYPSDILAGLVIGVLIGISVIYFSTSNMLISFLNMLINKIHVFIKQFLNANYILQSLGANFLAILIASIILISALIIIDKFRLYLDKNN